MVYGSLCHQVEPFKSSPFEKGGFNQLLAEIYPNGVRNPDRRYIAVASEDMDSANRTSAFSGRVISFSTKEVNAIDPEYVDGCTFPERILNDSFDTESDAKEYHGFRTPDGFKHGTVITHYAIELAAGLEAQNVDQATKSYALAILAKIPTIQNIGIHIVYRDYRVRSVRFYNLTD